MAMKEEELEKLPDGIDFKNLTAEQITGENGLLKILTKRVIEKAMAAEMDDMPRMTLWGGIVGTPGTVKAEKPSSLTRERSPSKFPGIGRECTNLKSSRNISADSRDLTIRLFRCMATV